MPQKKIKVLDSEIRIVNIGEDSEYFSVSDMAKSFGEPSQVLRNWMRTRSSLEYLTVWEKIHNPDFDEERALVFQFNAGKPNFSLSPEKWIKETKAKGIYLKRGRGGAVYAHEDIALELGMFLSPEFKVYLVSEFKKLKKEEKRKEEGNWEFKRELAKIFYRVHTDSIQEFLVPPEIRNTGLDKSIYASEANILNKALFGKTASEWRKENPDRDGNIRDFATPAQLVMMSMLESQNAFLISKGVEPNDRLALLNETAIRHMSSILSKPKNLGKLLKIEEDKNKRIE
jgi:hypothetical protein